MNRSIKSLLERQGYEVENYQYIGKTHDNIRIRHIKTGKIVDIRW